jgi:hypothetical protein
MHSTDRNLMWAVHRRLDCATQRNGLIATWGRLVPTIASWHMWGIVNRKSNVSRLGDDDKAESLEVLVQRRHSIRID